MLDLGVVILNWNTRDLLRNCLKSVFASTGLSAYRVVVVDNASTDGSAAMVRAEFPQALLIESRANNGYAAGNNLGLRALGFADLVPSREGVLERESAGKGEPPRYALLLNPDTVVPPTALAEMVTYMDARPQVGIAGPRLVLPNGQLDLACRRSFPTPEVSFYRLTGLSRLFPRSRLFGRYNLTYLSPDVETEVDSVVGAFMLVRGAAIAQAGLLDENFFMYGEDLDWALRIKQHGWQVRYNPAVTVLHVKRAASRRSRRAQIAFHEAMLYFYRKHYADVTHPLLGALVVFGIRLNLAWTILREAFISRDSATSNL
ncbi:MAG: glycosyltransferase family 2 protein [Anaerolineales bacterium]|nr:glycosyltransferase family 2 protein [Anaerolineales bacterium]